MPLVLTGVPVPSTTGPEPSSSPVPRTSLRLALELLTSGCEVGSRLVVFAGSPGDLTDLAADAERLRRLRSRAGPEGDAEEVVLDQDLPGVGLHSGVSGLDELVAANAPRRS